MLDCFAVLPENPRIRLWDVLVPLRAHFDVSVQVENGSVLRFELTDSNTGSIVLSEERRSHDPMVRDQVGQYERGFSQKQRIEESLFGRAAFDELDQIIYGKVVTGFRGHHRPVILSPLWADGIKRSIATVGVLSVIAAFRKAVIVGAPGSGKSTLARAIAAAHIAPLISSAEAECPKALGLWPSSSLYPVFIELRKFVRWVGFPRLNVVPTAQLLLDYIVQVYLENDLVVFNALSEALQNGSAIIVFDGLDEVPVPFDDKNGLLKRRRQILGLMHSVETQFPLARILATCRVAGYETWELPRFQVVRIATLDDYESRALAESVYVNIGLSKDVASQTAKKLLLQLGRVPRSIREFPLFLKLLALIFVENALKEETGHSKSTKNDKDNVPNELPVQRGRLLGSAIQLLLDNWTKTRPGEQSISEILGCTGNDLLGKLKIIARRAQKGAETTGAVEPEIRLGDIVEELLDIGKKLQVNETLEFISQKAGILVSPEAKKYRFAHRLFREYLCASHICDSEEFEDLVLHLCSNFNNWREVALLSADILENEHRISEIWVFLDTILARLRYVRGKRRALLAWLAGRIYLNRALSPGSQPAFRRICKSLQRQLAVAASDKNLSIGERADILESLWSVGDLRRGIGVKNGVPDIDWVRLPGGTLEMGTSDEAVAQLIKLFPEAEASTFERERPAHHVVITDLDVSRYPVTVSQFAAFVTAPDGFANDAWWDEHALKWRAGHGFASPRAGEFGSVPQTRVTWYEAVAFCRWLSARTSQSIRLPTEAEWEWAAKGGRVCLFPWGDSPSALSANVSESAFGRVCPVGCFDNTTTAWGDNGPEGMVGNTWEWCSSLVQIENGRMFSYPYVASDGREDMSIGDEGMRSTRGGFFGLSLLYARAAYRGRDWPSIRVDRQGFRVVKGIL